MKNEDRTIIKDDIIKLYDDEAASYDNAEWMARGDSARVPESAASLYFIGRKVEKALELSPKNRAARAHEIGCSFGHMTSLLAKEYDRLTASDISPKSIEIARKRLAHYGVSNVTFEVADAEALTPFPDSSFDITYSFSTIRFCPNPEKALTEIHRTLAPGGTLVVDFPNRYSPWHFLLKPLSGIRPHMHDTLYSKRTAADLLASAGFVDIAVVPFLFTTKRLPNALLPLFRLIDRVFERTPLRNFAGIIMVRAKKP